MGKKAWIGTIVVALAAASLSVEPAAFAQQKKPTPAEVAKAQGFFKQADQAFNAKRFQEALALFRQSYETVRSPNSHLYIARCLANLGDMRAAYLEFQSVYDEANARAGAEPKYAPTRDAARAERDELTTKLAMVTLTVQHPDASTTVTVGTVDVPAADWGKPLPINAGPTEIVIRTAGRPPITQTAAFAAGDRKELIVDAAPAVAVATTEAPAPVESKSRWNRPLLFAGIGASVVGVAGAVLFAVEGSGANSTFDKISKDCSQTTGCPAGNRHTDDVSTGQSQQTLANVGLIVGSVGVAAGATLIVMSYVKRTKTDPGPAVGLQVQPVVGPSYAGLSGTF